MARIGNKLIAICSAAIALIYTAGYAVTESMDVQASPNNPSMNQPPDNETNAVQSTQSGQPAATSIPNDQIVQPTPSETPVSIVQPAETIPSANTAQPTNSPVKVTPTPTRESIPVMASTSVRRTLAPTPTPVKSTPEPAIKSTPAPTPTVTYQKYQDGTYTGSGTNSKGTVQVKVTINKGKIGDVVITRSATRYPEMYIESLPQEVINRQDANVDMVSGATRSSEDFIMAVQQALRQAEQSR